MDVMIVLGIVAILTAICIYLFQKKDQKNQEQKRQLSEKNNLDKMVSNQRIQAVVDKYMDLYMSRRDTHVSALFKAGIKTLKNNAEITEALQLIEQHINESPLARYDGIIRDCGLYNFFQNTTWKEINELGGIENTIKKITSENN